MVVFGDSPTFFVFFCLLNNYFNLGKRHHSRKRAMCKPTPEKRTQSGRFTTAQEGPPPLSRSSPCSRAALQTTSPSGTVPLASGVAVVKVSALVLPGLGAFRRGAVRAIGLDGDRTLLAGVSAAVYASGFPDDHVRAVVQTAVSIAADPAHCVDECVLLGGFEEL